MITLKANTIVKKLFSLLSVVRGYNILVLIAAQYLAAIFIFSEQKSIKPVLFDWHLLYLVIATITNGCCWIYY
jgi:4-hydroxybenzoate polyprenyltransferase